ncbi:redox-sensing transcriptional repressor Rex [Gorillibacterium massiliense]|uniref:redox-sensing transcriptional repressor Rex n=1 Tax=Gorillibacterium massiliense TaxID=1280390 RepID=UPI0004B81C9E|nr:redox-sensing transcriptional repressor Rex [Gorillibacterium massiliense]
MSITVSKSAFRRLPGYLNYLYHKKSQGFSTISATVMAEEMNINSVLVRKDLASTGTVGRPKSGFKVDELIRNIIEMLGYNNSSEAVLVGAGQLGRALLSYGEFESHGVKIIAAFDTDQEVCHTEINEKKVFPLEQLPRLVSRLRVPIGVIAVPAGVAQDICDKLVDAGIQAIWNFAPVHLQVPETILVQNENMAASLAALSQHLKRNQMGWRA